MTRTTINVVQDGQIFYMRIGDEIYHYTAPINVHALSRRAALRAREAFAQMIATEFPGSEIEWVRNVWSMDRSADTLRTLSFRNDLAIQIEKAHVLYADE